MRKELQKLILFKICILEELLQNTDKNEEEIIETLIKTATQIPSSRYGLKEKRARTYGKYCK